VRAQRWYPHPAVNQPPGASFQIVVSSGEGDVRIVGLSGELDFEEAPHFGRVLDELRADGAREVIVDLSELTFIDSSGISALVSAARAASAEAGTLIVASPTAPVKRVFDIVNLSELLPIEDGLEGALQRIGRSREPSEG
jgi:anti-sigma B factor antagonist